MLWELHILPILHYLHCYRYKLLLTDLLKNTLPDDDDYAALTGMTLFLLAVFVVHIYCFVLDLLHLLTCCCSLCSCLQYCMMYPCL